MTTNPGGARPEPNDGFPGRSADYIEGFTDGLRAQSLIDEWSIAEACARITQLESERENWRVSSVNRELAKDRERIEYVRKNFANAIHYFFSHYIDGDEWNTKFYETLDKWMARDADRKGDGK